MILALDSVFEHCSVALVNTDGSLIDEQTLAGNRHQTQQILPMIECLLKNHQLKTADLTAIAFNRGPGAFSGIRINTAVAQALAFAHDLPCLPVSSLQAVAQKAFFDCGVSHVYSAIDARMNQVYLGEFVSKNQMMQLAPNSTEQLLDYHATTEKPVAIFGNGASLLTLQSQQVAESNVTPTAYIIGQIGAYHLLQGQSVSAEQALPVYLRHNAWKTLAEQGK